MMGRGGKDGDRAGRVRKRARANNAGQQWWRKLTLPRRGKKETLLEPVELSNAQSQKLKRRREKLRKAISAPRTARAKHMAVADWDESLHLARVTQQRGSALQSMGTFVGGTQHLHPEEALFLVDKGTLDLRVSGRPLSLQAAWALTFESPHSLTLEQYLTFVHLRRAGYVVRRTEESLSRPTDGALSVQLSAWRVGAFKRKDVSRPLFHVAVFTYADPPPGIREVSKLLDRTGKTRVKIALIDRGVVVLTDVANNATPLSDRFQKRFQNRVGTPAGVNEDRSAEEVVNGSVDSGDEEVIEEMNDGLSEEHNEELNEERKEERNEELLKSAKGIRKVGQEQHLEEGSRSFVGGPSPLEKVSVEVR